MSEQTSGQDKPLTFQELILTLQNFWASRGCVVIQPYDMEMGAGTFHTATFLRAISLDHRATTNDAVVGSRLHRGLAVAESCVRLCCRERCEQLCLGSKTDPKGS